MIITPQLEGNITYGLGGSGIFSSTTTQSILFDDFVFSYTIHNPAITDTLSFSDSVLKQYIISSTLVFTQTITKQLVYKRSIGQRIVFGQRNHRHGERRRTKPWIRLTYPDVVNKL